MKSKNQENKKAMAKLSLIEQYLTCPFCQSDIEVDNKRLRCKKCDKVFEVIDGDILSLLGNIASDTNLSMTKWDELYAKDFFIKESEKEYKELLLDDTVRQVLEYTQKNPEERKTFLELGCGQGFVGEELAKNNWLFIGIDFSLTTLRLLKKRLDNRGIENYLLIHGDVQTLPIKNNSIDLIFGGGVLEHFKNTQLAVDHIFRVLAKDGVALNVVPGLNIGTFFYHSLWGTIPNVPILKQLAEFIHLKILKSKHMEFGYELLFTTSQLKELHCNAGFKTDKIIIDRFDCFVQLNKINNHYLKKFLRNLCKKNRQFWPALKVIGIKS